MLRLRRIKAMAAWIACCALLLAALAPAISQALQGSAGPGWGEICSVAGSPAPAADDAAGNSGSERDGPHAFEHCPYCSVHAPGLGLPPARAADLTLPAVTHALPALFLAAPRTLFAWVSTQPRAPPLQA